jgi:glycosyltransferase involved in cell wall biosynthesis
MIASVVEGRPSVVVSHPGTQQVYETVAGLQSAGMLHRFLASAYATGDEPERRAPWRWLPPPQRAAALAGLRKRRHPAIDPALVHEMPWPFVVMRGVASGLSAAGLRRYAGVERLGDAWFDRLAASWIEHEPGITQVHAFEGEALHTFEAARRRGLRTVLDAPAAHEYNIALCDEEARAAGVAPFRRFGSPRRIAEERALADVVVSPSRFVTRCLREHGVGVSKIVEIPFGADVDLFTPPEHPRDPRTVPFTVLCVASINARKGTRYLLEAWSRLALPGSELVLVGTPDEFGARLLARHEGAFRHVPHVPWFDLPDVFRRADAFVLPSLAEGSALVTYMAMAAGLPVVVTEDAGAVARDGMDGFAVPSRDPDALAAAIARLHDDRAAAAAMGASGRALIAGQYTWRHYHQRIAALHQDLYDRADEVLPPSFVLPPRGPARIAWGMQL